jgi:sugar phosphate isomerase/epimerase
MTLPLSGCTFGWLHLAALPDALRALAGHGFASLELTTAPPHLFAPAFGPYERQELARTVAALGMRVVSVNPSFVDINLISTNPEICEISARQIIANLELAADLGASFVVVIPGRRHALAPAPDPAARIVLDRQLARLVSRAAELGVTLAPTDTWAAPPT